MSNSAPSGMSFFEKFKHEYLNLDPNNTRQLNKVTLCFIGFSFLLWMLLAILSQTAPHKDNIEQLFWIQSFDWGYPKFGPTSTWWLYAWVSVFGRSIWVTYLAAQINVALMLLVVWRICLLVMSPARALMAIVLTTLVAYHSINSIQMSSNILQLLPTALLLWTLLLAVRKQDWWRWMLVGIVGAVCLLTKYSAGIWFAVMGIWVLQDSRMHNWRAMSGVLIAIVTALVALIPHIEWLIRENAPTIRYMQYQVSAEVNHIARLGKFILSQLGKISPLIVALLILNITLKKDHSVATGSTASPYTNQEMRFISFATIGPMLLTCLLGTAFITLNANWATPYFIFLGVYVLRWIPQIDSARTVSQVLRVGLLLNIVIGCGYGLYYGLIADFTNQTPRANFPAKQLGLKLDQVWDAEIKSPLKVVIGETWIAGVTSVTSRYQPLVVPYGDYQAAAAANPELIKRCGALIVVDANENKSNSNVQAFMSRATIKGSFELAWNRFKSKPTYEVNWAIIEPEIKGACAQ
jgi:4-amino-4-deoxy-L-arabinose transferase-like glycosyltransferase